MKKERNFLGYTLILPIFFIALTAVESPMQVGCTRILSYHGESLALVAAKLCRHE